MNLQTIKIKDGTPATLNPGDNPTYEQWLNRVNKWVSSFTGLDLRDLQDMKYRDWYDARLRPIRAANRVIRAANRGDIE